MSDKFQNKYRIASNRLRGWDYSANGLYFITVVTHHRECVFGKIIDGIMELSKFGIIAHNEWFSSFQLRNELYLDEFILMPNHLHAIVGIDNDDIANAHRDGDDGIGDDGIGRDARPCVSTDGNTGGNTDRSSNESIFQRKPKSISSFVAGYKSSVITQIDNYIDENQLDIPEYNRQNPLWQSNYHDHIIRNQKSYFAIKQYIKNNPSKWDNDKFNQ